MEICLYRHGMLVINTIRKRGSKNIDIDIDK